MPLDVTKIKVALDTLSVAPNFPVSNLAAGQAWAEAIHPYSLDGVLFTSLIPQVILLTEANKDIMAATFAAGMVVPGTASTAATTLQTAIDAYWLTAITDDQIGLPVPVGSALLKTTLEAIFSTPSTDSDAKTTAISNAIDLYTRTVVFNILVPPSTPFSPV